MTTEELPAEVAERLARLPAGQRKAFLINAIDRELLMADFLAKHAHPRPEAQSLLDAARARADILRAEDRENLFDRLEALCEKLPASTS